MKILFETDPHFKELGSMANESRFNGKYSTRLDLMIESFKWLYEVARNNDVKLIIHGGDILDKPSISAKESHAIQESFRYNSTQISEFVLVGNHDKKDSQTHALAILANYPTVKIVDKPVSLGKVALLPYTHVVDYEEIKSISADILFSHVDILGAELISNVYSTKGFDPEILKNYFKIVLNGHLHTVGKYGIVHNTGSFFGSGLGDNYANGFPAAILIDTDTLEITRLENPFAIRYHTIVSNDLVEIKKEVLALITRPNKFYLRVQCLNEVKSEVRLLINSLMQEYPQILSSVIVGLARTRKIFAVDSHQNVSIQTSSNPTEILLGFIKTVEDKKLPASRKEIEEMIIKNYDLTRNNGE